MSNNNIYDTANQLERELRNSDVYKNLKTAYEAILANEESNQLFNEFRKLSAAVQDKQMAGEEPSEEEFGQLQGMTAKLTIDENVSQLIKCEQQASQLINDLNRIITQPLNEIYQNKPIEEN